MRRWNFCTDESGQDLVEYSLLLAFVCLASAALFIGAGKSIASIWSTANTSLSQAYSAANASS
jgi:Flp pilus assembly pilin Flp